MSEKSLGSALQLALVAGGLYIAYKIWQSFSPNNPNSVTSTVSEALANSWLNITNPSVLQPESQTMGIPGSVTFPNGAAVPFANIQNQSGVWSATDSAGNFYFTYQGGTVYQLTGQSVTGYQAVPSSFATLAQANAS